MDTKQIAKHFSRHAQDYDNQAIMQKEISDRLVELIPNRDYQTILDIGADA